jgi:hypothetical protein
MKRLTHTLTPLGWVVMVTLIGLLAGGLWLHF